MPKKAKCMFVINTETEERSIRHVFNMQTPMFDWMKCQCKQITVGEYNDMRYKQMKELEGVA